ncbi:MAG: hypothetical protein JWQ38_2499 [Flavipsychrobacter sp.]|nr:hypothetical protein [Flavipsychrobacter sp.]
MFVFNGFNFETEKRVADIGPLKIDKKETKHVGWPAYAGGVAVIAGIILAVATPKKA